jgi:PAS domain-containing protein
LTLPHHVSQLEYTPGFHGPASRRRPLRVLFVHGVDAEVKRWVRELKRARRKIQRRVVSSSEQFAKQLDSKYCNWHGPRILEVLRARKKRIPLIFLTDTVELETLADLITEGAADCVDRDHIGHLPIAVRRAFSENNLREERDLAEKRLRHSEARYRALVGNLVYGMCRCDSKGNFLEVNHALATMLGHFGSHVDS